MRSNAGGDDGEYLTKIIIINVTIDTMAVK